MAQLTAIPAWAPTDLDDIEHFYRTHGFVLIRGLYDDDMLAALDHECADAQARLGRREFPDDDLVRYGTDVLDDPEAQVGGQPFAHYVCYITELSPAAAKACDDGFYAEMGRRLLGADDPWLLDYERFGVVYQDARTGDGPSDHPATTPSGSGVPAGRVSYNYSRIGWHSDWQSGPHLAIWPSFAFTIHLDPTSPANGFLRVVPGSHQGPPDAMPPTFERIPGEIEVYTERVDVLLNDGHLWHSAARATVDGDGGIRRHLRGGWFGGERLDPGHGLDDFVKNAAR
jgi:hypothetical protein